jgi:hypothetical protein
MDCNHDSIILLHEEMFRNLQKSLDALVKADQDRNCRYDNHLKEAIPYRTKVDQNAKDIDDIRKGHREIRGYGITIIILILGWAWASVWWASAINRQVDVNTKRLEILERKDHALRQTSVNL